MNKFVLVLLLSVISLTQLKGQSLVHLCKGETHNFAVPFTAGSSYNWEINGDTIAIDTIVGDGTEHIIVSFKDIGLLRLVLKETNINGCFGFDSVLVKIHPLPEPVIYSLEPTICEGEQLELKIDSLYALNIWNNGALGLTASIDTAGDYFVTVTDTNGCTNNSDTITVKIIPKPVANFSIEQICLSRPTNFINSSVTDTGIINFKVWNLLNGSIANKDTVSFTYPNLGNYTTELIVVSDLGCSDTLSKEFSIYNNPEASFIFNTYNASVLHPDVEFTNTSNNVQSVFWDFNDAEFSIENNPTHTFKNPGLYQVLLIVADTNQCIDSVSHAIKVSYDFVLYLPNAFTPDGDGVNDLFGPKGLRMEKYQAYNFTVYNRWGELVFTTDTITEYWDALAAPVGVYGWVIRLKDELGVIREAVGEVSLIR